MNLGMTSNGQAEAAKAFRFASNMRNLNMAETAQLVKATSLSLVPKATGRLAGSIRVEPNGYNRYVLKAGYEGDRPIAWWQHYGTVKNKRNLYFWKAGAARASAGKARVRKQVRGAALKSGYRA